jgi:hypothetical protein
MEEVLFDLSNEYRQMPETKRLVRAGGFTRPCEAWSLFYFRRAIGFLRFTEGALSRLPRGAQYCVLADA